MEELAERCASCGHVFGVDENKIMLLTDKSMVCQHCFDQFYGGISKSPPSIDPDVVRNLLSK